MTTAAQQYYLDVLNTTLKSPQARDDFVKYVADGLIISKFCDIYATATHHVYWLVFAQNHYGEYKVAPMEDGKLYFEPYGVVRYLDELWIYGSWGVSHHILSDSILISMNNIDITILSRGINVNAIVKSICRGGLILHKSAIIEQNKNDTHIYQSDRRYKINTHGYIGI